MPVDRELLHYGSRVITRPLPRSMGNRQWYTRLTH